MKRITTIAFWLSFAVLSLTISCTSFKRYRSVKFGGYDNTLASIDLERSKIDPPEKKDDTQNLWKLGAQGQAALIKTLSKRDTGDKKFIKDLNATYLKKDDDAAAAADYVSKDLQLVFSISKKVAYNEIDQSNTKFSLADRIELLDFSLTIPGNTPLKFIKWNQYTTKYGNINIGDVSFTKSLSATAGIGDTTTKISPTISATGSASKTETQHIQYRYVQMTGTLDDKKLMIKEEGEREIDLTGNVIANVSLKFEYLQQLLFGASSLQDDDGKYNKPDKVSLKISQALVPQMENAPDTISGNLTLNYTYRHVENPGGVKTFYEWDDEVAYYNGSVTKQVALFAKKDILPPFYFIGKIG